VLEQVQQNRHRHVVRQVRHQAGGLTGQLGDLQRVGTDASMLAALISSNTEAVYGHWDDEPVDAPPGPFDPQTADDRRAEHRA
jgi:hypothetical protein